MVLSFCCISCSSQEKGRKNNPFIHKVKGTATSIEMIEFNTKERHNITYVTETVDSMGRVSELRFYNSMDELTYAGSGFLGGPIIRYEYLENKIIETFFETETTIAHDFCCSEVPYRHIYYLNKENHITEIDFLHKMDFEWNNESLQETIKNLKLYKEFESHDTRLNHVFGYQFSYAKMNRVNPSR